MNHDFKRLFNPRSIAIIGVNEKPYGGGFFLKCLKAINYDKPIYLFNPRLKGKKIHGIEVFGSVLELAETHQVDYAIVAVPARACPSVLEEIGKKGIPYVSIFSSGFSEIGNVELEKNLLEIARKYNFRIIGPNCLGIYVPMNKVSFSWRLNSKSGNFGLISQSGGLAIQLSLMASNIFENPISKAISIGNQVDLNFVDFLKYFYLDNDTDVIGLYLENIKSKKQGRKFLKIVKKLTLKNKPVIIWRVGAGESSKEAIKSHTGGLATSNEIWEAISKQTGACLVNNAFELENLAMTFKYVEKYPPNENIGIVSVGGGASIQVSDVLEQHGLKIPKLNPKTQKKILNFIPDVNTIVRNPLDLGSSGIDPNIFCETIAALDNDPNISLIVFAWVVSFDKIAIDSIREVKKRVKKPVLALVYKLYDDIDYLNSYIKFKKELFELKIPVYESLDLLAKSLVHFFKFKRFYERNYEINNKL